MESPAHENLVITLHLISLNLVVGNTNPSYMTLIGTIRETEVVVVIDLRASHDFISTIMVKTLNINVISIGDFSVLLGIGVLIEGTQVC